MLYLEKNKRSFMEQFFFELPKAYNDNFVMSPPLDSNTCDPHVHRQMEILYVLSGVNRATINNQSILLTKNQLAIADSFDIHKWEHVSDVSIMVQFPYNSLKPYLIRTPGKKLSSNFILDPTIGLQFKALIDLMPQYANDPIIIDGLIQAFIGLLTKHIPLKKHAPSEHTILLNDILFYIEDNFDKDLTLEKVASHFAYSKYHFSRLFNQMLGIHFETYINMVRIQNVLYLVKEKKVALIDAIFESGFSSVSTCYRTFKNYYNCGIQAYLKKYINSTPQFILQKRTPLR